MSKTALASMIRQTIDDNLVKSLAAAEDSDAALLRAPRGIMSALVAENSCC